MDGEIFNSLKQGLREANDMTTHPAIKAAIEAIQLGMERLNKAQEHIGELEQKHVMANDRMMANGLTNDAYGCMSQALITLRALEGCVVIERGDVPEIIESIVADLSDRRGLKNEWFNIDDDIQQEIKAEWAALVAAQMKGE